MANADWQAKWDDRDKQGAEARTLNEAAERTKEQTYQQSINKSVQDGQRTIDQATADAAAARASADVLRGGGQRPCCSTRNQ
ncbi:DUF2514 domain-containing protein [Pseudomonas sp. GL-B-19]|uniref:DUF2514 domain-containing protein n=1 Tax=Pseudomonas sp. GL-B-19 TaxID=2832393 RepID=UPI0021D85969|nr:DUF2514 domain-containing protein [Pseudomonas sp. GL-B-19]